MINIEKGIKFECQGSGNCCVSRGSYGFVYLSKEDVKNLSINFNLSSDKFIKKYCSIFLEDKRCSVYTSRPVQCRTWPFWPENMNSKTWNNEISKNCPGIGKGKIIKKREILKQINADYKNALSIKGNN